MNKDQFDDMFDEDMNLGMALAASEVGVDAIKLCIDYFSNMLVHALIEIGNTTGENITEVKTRLERDLNLTNVIEESVEKIRATKEVVIEIFKDDFED